MRRWTRMTVWPGVLTATVLLTASCDRSADPAEVKVGQPNFWAGYVPALDRMTGGGKLNEGRDFATFGFEVRPGKVNLEWQQHCLDGVNPSSPTCSFGQFSFHALTLDEYLQHPDDPAHCRIWTGTGEVKLKDPSMQQYNGTYNFTVDKACDYGEPGKDTDFMSITISSYHRGEILNGGNIQLHKAQP